MRKIVQLFAAAGLTLVVLSGCGSARVTGSGHLASNVTNSHPRPVEPAETHENSEKGAIAAAKYWLEATYYGIYTGDTGPLRDISLPSCTTCEATEKTIDATYKHGARNEGGDLVIESESVDYFDPGKTAVVSFEVKLGNSVTIEADGHQSGSSTPSKEINQFELHWTDEKWKVAEGAKLARHNSSP